MSPVATRFQQVVFTTRKTEEMLSSLRACSRAILERARRLVRSRCRKQKDMSANKLRQAQLVILNMRNMLKVHKGKHKTRINICEISEALPNPQRETDLRPWQASLPKRHLFSEQAIHESWNLRKAWLSIFRPELLNYSCACQRPNSRVQARGQAARPNSSAAETSHGQSL